MSESAQYRINACVPFQARTHDQGRHATKNILCCQNASRTTVCIGLCLCLISALLSHGSESGLHQTPRFRCIICRHVRNVFRNDAPKCVVCAAAMASPRICAKLHRVRLIAVHRMRYALMAVTAAALVGQRPLSPQHARLATPIAHYDALLATHSALGQASVYVDAAVLPNNAGSTFGAAANTAFMLTNDVNAPATKAS